MMLAKWSAFLIKFLGILKKSKFLETHRHLANISNVNDCQSGFVLPFCNIDLQLWLSVCQKTVLAIKGT